MLAHVQATRKRLSEMLPLLAPEFPTGLAGATGTPDLERSIILNGGRVDLAVRGDQLVVLLRLDDAAQRGPFDDLVEDALDAQNAATGVDDGDLPPVAFERATPFGKLVGSRRGAVWEAEVELPAGATGRQPGPAPVIARLAGWNVDPATLSLVPLDDLTPWFARWDRLGQHTRDDDAERPAPPPVTGNRDSIRALIEQAARTRAQPREPRDRRARRRARPVQEENFWPAATAAVEAATGLDEYDAASALARVVNELADLFTDEAARFAGEVRERALEESIDFLLSGTAATSGTVQEQSSRVWELEQQVSAAMRARPVGDTSDTGNIAGLTRDWAQARSDLRHAWVAWAAGQL